MGLFQELEGDVAVIVSGGVFKQVPVFTRDGYLFAATSGGFVRLMADGATSKAKTRIDVLSIEAPLFKDKFGRLAVEKVSGAKPIDAPAQKLLLGAETSDG